ncbi:DNA double-strand break repair nuclease NurA [Halalkalibacter urbisdiaboli]|uniref:DNA double-strand break repair nuclease NurA n=1 Tax=Halalkalibacter urbisdiaboli TaxID=1960589 RepID=UPI000B4413AE|nr:DNA double-strand break repair nuclease NurA [Halalkalibacter urbisdiaboli]
MFQLAPDFVEKVKKLGESLRQTYQISTEERKIIRQKLKQSSAVFRQMYRYSHEDLSKYLNGRQLAAVDGSVNQTKGESPHVVYLFQALAKTTNGQECRASDVYAPLLEERTDEEEATQPVKWRAHLLAKLELEVAYKLIESQEIAFMMMDGALYHYRIDAPKEWDRLRILALEQNVLLVGVSEEITTENLVKLPSFSSFQKRPYSYDRDLLFGILDKGETLFVEEIQQKAGLQSVWMRPSSSPAITGFDMLEEQAMHKNEVADLLYTLTPSEGRGIPLWLDHIDRDVRVTDKLVEALIEQYIDPETRQRFFTRKRTERPY